MTRERQKMAGGEGGRGGEQEGGGRKGEGRGGKSCPRGHFEKSAPMLGSEVSGTGSSPFPAVEYRNWRR